MSGWAARRCPGGRIVITRCPTAFFASSVPFSSSLSQADRDLRCRSPNSTATKSYKRCGGWVASHGFESGGHDMINICTVWQEDV